MKLTLIRARGQAGYAELEVELDGVHYEAVRIELGADAQDVASSLHRLAERIARRTAATSLGQTS